MRRLRYEYDESGGPFNVLCRSGPSPEAVANQTKWERVCLSKVPRPISPQAGPCKINRAPNKESRSASIARD
jgi:hypothetical protein